MPNILRPSKTTETVKLNSLKKKKNGSSSKLKQPDDPSNSDTTKSFKVTRKDRKNILDEEHVEIEIDDSPLSLSPETNRYGALASTSANLFQQEPDQAKDVEHASLEDGKRNNSSGEQETPQSGDEYAHINKAYTNDLV